MQSDIRRSDMKRVVLSIQSVAKVHTRNDTAVLLP